MWSKDIPLSPTFIGLYIDEATNYIIHGDGKEITMLVYIIHAGGKGILISEYHVSLQKHLNVIDGLCCEKGLIVNLMLPIQHKWSHVEWMLCYVSFLTTSGPVDVHFMCKGLEPKWGQGWLWCWITIIWCESLGSVPNGIGVLGWLELHILKWAALWRIGSYISAHSCL